MAEILGIPCVVGVTGLEASDGSITVTRHTDTGTEKYEVPLPALITAEKGLFEPRVPAVTGVARP